ncbi:ROTUNDIFOLIA like 17 [Rhynchospora pubera]|uniref:ROTUNDIFOLIA like 17 n=1 Tax=Rhynchospora pubera TaxID=906938 RepID=A0AAV8C3E4_9POAL|nr:ROTUNDIFOLIA like 17 [Rhynchospora pubera]
MGDTKSTKETYNIVSLSQKTTKITFPHSLFGFANYKGEKKKKKYPHSPFIQKMKLGGHRMRKEREGLSRSLKEKRAKLYIIRRCIVLLLPWNN